MRVVHIFPHLKPGGAERVLVHIMTHLDRSRFEVSAICLAKRSGSDLEQLLDLAGIPVQYLGKGLGFNPRLFARVHCALHRAAPDILHSHVHVLRYLLPYIGYSHFLRQRPRMLHTVHSLAEFEVEPRARWIQRLAFRDGVLPIAVAGEVSRSVARLYGIAEPAVVPNCLPVQRYRSPETPRDQWREREGFAPESLLLTCVAGLRPEKNHSLLLKAFAQTSARRSGGHLLLAGGGDQTALRKLAGDLGIGSSVHFLGVRTDIPDLLAASDFFVLASHYEGNPLCIMEAMAAGLPVVAPRVGGIPELVTHGLEGFLVDTSEPGDLSHAMDTLLADEPRRIRMGAASAERAIKNFDITHMIAGYESLYNAALNSPSLYSSPSEQQL
ncbi:MAG TPA: glycosyltransferase [Bryobacteraceae bacterium]|nr:glycosyltransferase [Bryobacteraceae bacterium]